MFTCGRTSVPLPFPAALIAGRNGRRPVELSVGALVFKCYNLICISFHVDAFGPLWTHIRRPAPFPRCDTREGFLLVFVKIVGFLARSLFVRGEEDTAFWLYHVTNKMRHPSSVVIRAKNWLTADSYVSKYCIFLYMKIIFAVLNQQ